MMGSGRCIMAETILIIEDDRSISEMVEGHLQMEGYDVVLAFDGHQGERLISRNSYDLILLDLMLPGMNGMDLLRRIREKSWVPVLIVSARNGDVDKALGLGFGADDYLAKPFSLVELTARIKASIRRAKLSAGLEPTARGSQPIRLFDLIIDQENYSVSKNGQEIRLTAKEFAILCLFATHPNRVFTKAQLYERIWNDDYYGDENLINVHMRRLREKIEDDPSAPRYIKTLWGIGYKLGDR